MTPTEYLYGLELHGIKLGLDNIRQLAGAAGDPQCAYRTVHVGGTNGKGSVVAILDAMLQAAGYRTGRFTSPHLCNISERFLVDSRPIDGASLEDHITFFRATAEEMSVSPTFFEMNTAIAFRHFERSSVDVGLIEVGMGGRFDSTNIIRPIATAITNIALEHTKYLGDTLEAIAFEKAGIIKPAIPLVLGETATAPAEVILDRANELGSPTHVRDRDFRFTIDGPAFAHSFSYASDGLELETCSLGIPGSYQGMNAAVAVGLAEAIRSDFDTLDEASIRAGLAAARWPCRLERVLESPEVIIDVAHNAAGARELASALQGPCVIILAIANDKDATRIIETLAPKASPLILTAFAGRRSLPVDVLCERAGSAPYARVSTLREAIEIGLARSRSNRIPLVIAGSLFTAGEARRHLVENYGAPPLRF